MGSPHIFVKVTAETLTAKAEEITGTWPIVPAPPIAPCQLAAASQGVAIICSSRERLEGVLKAGEAEAKRLAACLKAAATAYQTVDDHRKADLDRTISGDGAGPAPSAESVTVNPDLPPSVPAPFGQNPVRPDPNDHEDWIVAVDRIAATDQGASLRSFAEGLDGLATELKDRAKKFSMANTSWEGAAAEAAEGALRRHESWIYEVVAKAEELAKETRKLDDIHLAERASHPDEAEKTAFLNKDLNYQANNYESYQNRSGDSQSRYANGATLSDVYAPDPPDGAFPATPVKAGDLPDRGPQTPGGPAGPGSGSPGGGSPGGGAPGGGSPAGRPTGEPSVSPASANPGAGKPESGSPAGGGSPSGGGSPAGGGTPVGGGMPGGGMPGGPNGLPELPKLDDPGVSPAGLGGGGGGGTGAGGGGAPSPLGPPVGAETVAPSPAGGRGAAGPGAPGAPGGAGMGGGMGGMGHGGGQGQGKEKRRDPNLSPDEEMYVEDRAYTEGVIGRQSPRRRAPQEGKGDK